MYIQDNAIIQKRKSKEFTTLPAKNNPKSHILMENMSCQLTAYKTILPDNTQKKKKK